MQKYIFTFVLLGLLEGCATIGKQGLSDSEYSARLVGTWTISENEDGKYAYFEKTYHADGAADGHSTEGQWTDDGVYIEEYGFRFQSKWKVQDGVVVIWDIVSEPPGVFKDGAVIQDRILYIGNKEAKYRDVDHGHTFFRYRK